MLDLESKMTLCYNASHSRTSYEVGLMREARDKVDVVYAKLVVPFDKCRILPDCT